MLRHAVHRVARVSSKLLSTRTAAFSPSQFAGLQWSGNCKQETSRFDCVVARRGLATSAKKSKRPHAGSDSVQTQAPQQGEKTMDELLEMIETSRDDEDAEREVELSLKLYEVLKQRGQQDADTFQVAFGIAQIYDGQLDDKVAATTYYKEALKILEATSTEATAWSAYMHVTALGSLGVCYEELEQPQEAEEFFDLAIVAYQEHCDQVTASDTKEEDTSESDLALLADLNATAAMIHYHYAGNLLAQECWEEAKSLTEAAVVLAENSSMSSQDLEELQRFVHDLWLEMDTK